MIYARLTLLIEQASNGRTVPRSSVVPPRPRAPRRARTKCNQSTTESGVGAEEGGWKWRRAFRAFRLQQLPLQKFKMDMVYADAAALGGSSLIVDNREKIHNYSCYALLPLRLDMIYFFLLLFKKI